MVIDTRAAEVPPAPDDVPALVHNLLKGTQQLQDALRLWSEEQVNEEYVSDVYVRVGNDFNATMMGFAYHDIDLSEISTVPNSLRAVLEQCLGEIPAPSTLDKYMPEVRRVVWNLLAALHNKQNTYWAAVRQLRTPIRI